MQVSFRYGDEASAKRYPLPVSTDSIWQIADRVVSASIPIPPCPLGHILVPSVSLPKLDTGFQCALEANGAAWPLHAVPPAAAVDTKPADSGAKAPPTHAQTGSAEVSTHIDCFHTERDLPESRLLIRLACSVPPERFLVTLSIRPLLIDAEPPASDPVLLTQPPAISQMQGPASIRRRICSPTALTMTLQAAQPAIAWQSVVEACCDGRFYGSWPLAIHCAAAHGRIGAVEAVASWEPVIRILRAGSPVVASIRFGRGELLGAPLASTNGHLVTVYGIDGNRVLVHDPAAPDAASVPRSYDAQAFTSAWLRHRGAAYLLAPP